MKNARTLLVLLALFGLFLAGWWLGRRSVGSSVIELTRIDTVFFERPQSVTHSRQLVSVNIPKLLFAPADTVFKTVIVPDGTDSVPVRLPFERREYRDSTYYAVVSGIAVGGYRPTLERIETYGRTVTQIRTVRDPYGWEAGPAAGVYYADRTGGVWVGITGRKNFGRLALSTAIGYDTHNGTPFGQAQIVVTLWRK